MFKLTQHFQMVHKFSKIFLFKIFILKLFKVKQNKKKLGLKKNLF